MPSKAELPDLGKTRIGVMGLGYVGLPLAVTFAGKYATVGFDRSAARVAELRAGSDSTLEVSDEELASAQSLEVTDNPGALAGCNVIIVAVPTPVDEFKRPDLSPLESASRAAGRQLKRGTVVIFESTVYPGATEEVCQPILESESGLRCNEDFWLGYSPERINPGDKEHGLTSIVKVTSGSTPEAATFVDALYASIVEAGTHKASSIRVAEAAKVIENTQRDINIALINELAMLFSRLGIDTSEVLAAAGTKWNFLNFRPGLVGGHCIGVDPYYLTHKAQEVGFFPEMILAGRRINDNMGRYVSGEIIRLMANKNIAPGGARVLVLGVTFKENCPDLRNTRVVDVISELERFGAKVDVHDPWVSESDAARLGVRFKTGIESGSYDAIVLAVAHNEFRDLSMADLRAMGKPRSIVYEIKHVLPPGQADGRL